MLLLHVGIVISTRGASWEKDSSAEYSYPRPLGVSGPLDVSTTFGKHFLLFVIPFSLLFPLFVPRNVCIPSRHTRFSRWLLPCVLIAPSLLQKKHIFPLAKAFSGTRRRRPRHPRSCRMHSMHGITGTAPPVRLWSLIVVHTNIENLLFRSFLSFDQLLTVNPRLPVHQRPR